MFKVILLAISFAIASPAFAGLDEGIAAFIKDDFATALREFEPLAEFLPC